MPRSALAFLLALAACTDRPIGGDTDATSTGGETTTTSTTSTTTPTTTGEPTSTGSTTGDEAACLEAAHRGDGYPMDWMLTCDLPELCPGEDLLVFQLGIDDLLDPGTVDVDDLERARCMAAALRDRTPGRLEWAVVVGFEAIFYPLGLEVLGDTALAHAVRFPVTLDLPGPKNVHESLHLLRPPEFFADCADGDAMQVWLCLVDSVEPDCLPGPLACPD